MKKFIIILGIAFAAVGAVVTGIDVRTQTSEAYPFSFGFGIALVAPSLALGRALGIQEGTNGSLWTTVRVLVAEYQLVANVTLAVLRC